MTNTFINFVSGTLLLVYVTAGTIAQAAERVVIGISPSLTASLAVIAKEKGFFAAEGLDVEVRNVMSGSKGVELMLKGDIDLAESTLFPLVTQRFNRKDFSLLASISVVGNDNVVLARKDHSVDSLKSLKGKRIGTIAGGFPGYVLGLMLLDAGVSPKEVQIVLGDPATLVSDIAAGRLDAVCLFGGWVDRVKQSLGTNCVAFEDADIVRVTCMLVGKSAKLEGNPGIYCRLLKAYIRAETYLRSDRDHALESVIDYLKLDKVNARKVAKTSLFKVSLNQSLICEMENMARWHVATGLRQGPEIPDYLDLFWFKGLNDVEPGRVTIVHKP
ncbi:MAG: ABC transporter substrate-binding protein [bacterium]